MLSLRSRVGPYRIVAALGQGAMGSVFQAVHERIDRRVAIKVLRPEYAHSPDMAQRFINEARAVNLVEHPGLVQISDYGQLSDGTAYIVMEYLAGETLARRMQRSPDRLALSDVLHICWQLADSLAAAHEKGVIHRDLKPANVMLVPDPHMPQGERAKLLDFGLAKLLEPGGAGAGLVSTGSGAVLGTPLYMSPEQCEGAGRVDARTDVYSLGVLLYELLSGRPPFLAHGPGRVLGMHLYQPPASLRDQASDVPEPVADLCHRLLEKDRDSRPSMRTVADEIESLRPQGPPGVSRRREPAKSTGAAPPILPPDDALGLADTAAGSEAVPPLPTASALPMGTPADPPPIFRVERAHSFPTPSGYLSISIDSHGNDRIYVNPLKFESLSKFIDGIFSACLHAFYEPNKYGQDWVLVKEDTNRILIDWNWLLIQDKRQFVFDRGLAAKTSLPSCGLSIGSKWRVLPTSAIKLAFGAAVHDPEVFGVVLRHKNKLPLLQKFGLLASTRASNIDPSRYEYVGVFCVSTEEHGIAEDESFVQKEIALPIDSVRHIIKKMTAK